jgi:hypothetical protein
MATHRKRYVIAIHFASGHVNRDRSFRTYTAAMDYARDGISYGGGVVRRVELEENGFGARALWDASWDAASQAAGLHN